MANIQASHMPTDQEPGEQGVQGPAQPQLGQQPQQIPQPMGVVQSANDAQQAPQENLANLLPS